ncbi:MAG: GAF domain-containing protein [Anaerolineaceae bacterium]|nr:GAF domain-containing protein [Anaerolineaceae bacterium]
MIGNEALVLGIVFAVVGLLFFVAARLLLRTVPGMRPQSEADVLAAETGLNENADAVLIVQSGGWVRSINQRAREAFALQSGEVPDLERLIRRIRPAEAFIELCAKEGQARFVLDGRMAEGTSYRLQLPDTPAVLVSLRFPELAAELIDSESSLSGQALKTFTELNQEMAASLDLDDAIRAVLENVEKLIPADFMELTIWDNETQSMVPYRFTGLAGGERSLEQGTDRYLPSEGYAGYLYRERQPLLIPNTETRTDLRPTSRTMGVRSFIGIPLLAGDDFVGTLELGSRTPGSFREQDLAMVRLLSGQAAIAVHNALLFREEKRRAAELSGLAQVAQAFSSVRDPKSLYSRLVGSIAPLIQVKIVGFLIYNEGQRILEGQIPFHGLPDQFVELYRTPILPNSAAEQTLLDQDVLITENAADDPQWETLGLDYLAQAASLRDTVLVPLNSGGRMMGYLQVSNHLEGDTFTQSELHLLMIVANQSASIIENASLVQQSRLRAQRAEALRRIVSLAGSVASLDEVLQFSTNELVRLLHVDVAAVFLIDQARTQLSLHKGSLFGVSTDLPDRETCLLADDPQFPFTVSDSQHTLRLVSASEEQERPVVPFYQNLIQKLGIESMVLVPLVVRNEGVGELLFASRQANFFDNADVQMMATAAGHLAGVVEQAYLRTQTDEGLRRRVDQMVSIGRISRGLTNTQDPQVLANLVYEEAVRISGAPCGKVILFDMTLPKDHPLEVKYAAGEGETGPAHEGDLRMLEVGISNRVQEYNGEANLPPHEGIVCSLSTPIMYRSHPAGLIVLHATETGVFDGLAQEIVQSLAVQAAAALGNAIQYEEQAVRSALLKRELDTLTELMQISQMLRPSLPLEQSLLAISSAIQQATPFTVNVISVNDPETGMLRRVCATGVPTENWAELQAHEQNWESLQSLMDPQFRVGNVYFIPADNMPALPEELYSVTLPYSSPISGRDAWNENDFLLMPLSDSAGNPIGMISVDSPSDGRRPDRPTFEALEIFGIQAALMIENHFRISRLEGQVERLELDSVRLHQTVEATRDNLPMMLRKDLDQTVALQSINRRVERVRASLEIGALASGQPDTDKILQVLCNELLSRFAMQMAFIAEQTPIGLRLVEVIGNIPAGANPDALFGQRNPLRQMLLEPKNREVDVLLVANLENHPDWHNNPLLNSLEARSLIVMVMGVDKNLQRAVMLIGRRTLPAFSAEDKRIFEQLGRQVMVGMQNLVLLTETQQRLTEVNLLLEFSLKLGTLKAENILAVLVESVVGVLPTAQAGWVAMWDDKQASLVPKSAMGYTDSASMLNITYGLLSPTGDVMDARRILPLRVYRLGEPVRAAEVDFTTQYHLTTEQLLNYRKATNGRLPLSAMVLPLRMGDAVSGVLMLENFDTTNAFTSEDEALAYSFTQQASLALDNARLFNASERRANQLQSLTRVSSILTSSLKTEELVVSLLDLLKLVIPFETATLWLRQGNNLTVAATKGFEDDTSREGLTVDMEDSAMFRDMVKAGEPISVLDVRNDRRFPALSEPTYLSWLGLPLIAKGQMIGLIAMEKREVDFYTHEYVNAATTFASQAAVALENARLFEESSRRATELDERSQRLGLLNRLSEELSSSLEIDKILGVTSQQILDAMEASVVACVMVEPGTNFVIEKEVPETGGRLPLAILDVPIFERLYQTQGVFSTADVANEPMLASLREAYFAPRGVQSVLAVPMATGSLLHGWLMIQSTEDRRFSPSEIELAQTVCNQAAIAVQNARSFEETRSLTEFLERRVEERTGELKTEHSNMQTLLRVIGELSASLDMGLVLNRALTVINESLNAEESLAVMLQGTQRPYRTGETLASGEEKNGRTYGLERDIAKWVARHRKAVVLEDITQDERWVTAENEAPAYRSVLAVPLVMGEDALGGLVLLHREKDHFKTDQINLVEATARQIGISLNNAELFNLIRDQSEHLGNMLREQQIEASRSIAILEAVADGVVVTDDRGRINLFNKSAETILELRGNDLIGQPLELFAGLFGKSGSAWMRTIRNWSEAPGEYSGETFADEFELDNGLVIAVHLAPVFYRSQFLGTVSIFRDITHQVQVDRLKSEFVANVSHELRTPMTSIKGYVEIMLMGAAGQITDQQKHFLGIVKSNTERLGVLVNDLLDISRIESGRVTLNLQSLNLRELAEDVILDLERRAREENKGMTFKLECPVEPPVVMGDMERIRQVLGNLVSNGYNYSPAGSLVRVRITDEGEYLQVDVIDNGIGIGAEERERIFERFYRGEDPLVLASAGTGLGLSIARTIVNMHNGRIWFNSNGVRGEGSTFSFTLPVYTSGE